MDDVLVYREDIRRKSTRWRTRIKLLPELSRSWRPRPRYLDLARDFAQALCAARKLEKTVEAEINDLAMKARFQIEVSGSDEEEYWTGSGFDLCDT